MPSDWWRRESVRISELSYSFVPIIALQAAGNISNRIRYRSTGFIATMLG